MLEENVCSDCDKHIKDMVVDAFPNDYVVILNSESIEANTKSSIHPHHKKLPKHHHSWSITSLALNSLQKRRERMNRGPIPTIRMDCGWIGGWSWHYLNSCLQNSCIIHIVMLHSVVFQRGNFSNSHFLWLINVMVIVLRQL